MRRKGDLPTKDCQHCRRPFTWRKAWAKSWDEVRYCSDRCRGEASAARQRRVGGESVGGESVGGESVGVRARA